MILIPPQPPRARAARLRYVERDPAVARRFLAEYDRALERIRGHPERWPLYPHVPAAFAALVGKLSAVSAGAYRGAMRWPDVRDAHPDQWLVIEALDARSQDDRRIIDRVAVIDICVDGRATMKRHAELRRLHPHREFCFVHTSMTELKIEERLWLGIRGLRATDVSA